MTTQLAPNRTDLPPPRTSSLSDAGRVVGWVGDETIGFGGFANEDEAMSAAWMAHRILSRLGARPGGPRPVPIDVEPLSLVRDGGREAIRASGRTIATLIRPGDSRSGPGAFGFELRVPAWRDPARTRALAFLIYRTLRRSGIRWALWRADARADARPVRRDAQDGRAIAATAASGPSVRDDATRDDDGWRRIAGALVLPAIVAVAVLLPMITTSVLVSVLGVVAALVAVVALGALVRLVATDVRGDVRSAMERRRGGASRRPLQPAALASQLGQHLSAYHRARSGR